MAAEVVNLTVEGMSCQHCVNSIQKALGSLTGVRSVQVDLEHKKVIVDFEPQQVTIGQMKEAIEDQGYDVVG